MKNKSPENGPLAVSKAYDFVLWLVQKVETFPRSHRFTIGERLAANGLDLLTVNSTRLLLRMAKDLKLMSLDA